METPILVDKWAALL